MRSPVGDCRAWVCERVPNILPKTLPGDQAHRESAPAVARHQNMQLEGAGKFLFGDADKALLVSVDELAHAEEPNDRGDEDCKRMMQLKQQLVEATAARRGNVRTPPPTMPPPGSTRSQRLLRKAE
jgi:hypothetical protein